MTRTLELPPELEKRLQVLAAQRGATVETVAVQELAARVLNADDAPADEAMDALQVLAQELARQHPRAQSLADDVVASSYEERHQNSARATV